MKNGFRRMMIFLLAVFVAAAGTGCSGKDSGGGKTSSSQQEDNRSASADVDYFVWEDGKYIYDLTDEGRAQNTLVIPAACEGFTGMVFQKAKATTVSFEDTDDFDLSNGFMGAETVENVVLPAGLTSIPSMAFMGCAALKKISIPAGVTEVGSQAFMGCTSLEEVTFQGESVTVLSKECFQNCQSLKSFTVPGSVTSIEEQVFNASGLEELHFAEGVQLDSIDAGYLGSRLGKVTFYVVRGSWCDQNRDVWNTNNGEVKEE